MILVIGPRSTVKPTFAQTCQLSLFWREISLFRAKSPSWNTPSGGRFFSLQKLNLLPISLFEVFRRKYWKSSSLEKNLPLWQPISYLFSVSRKKIATVLEICLVMIAKFYTNCFNLVKYNDENSFFEEKIS